MIQVEMPTVGERVRYAVPSGSDRFGRIERIAFWSGFRRGCGWTEVYRAFVRWECGGGRWSQTSWVDLHRLEKVAETNASVVVVRPKRTIVVDPVQEIDPLERMVVVEAMEGVPVTSERHVARVRVRDDAIPRRVPMMRPEDERPAVAGLRAEEV